MNGTKNKIKLGSYEESRFDLDHVRSSHDFGTDGCFSPLKVLILPTFLIHNLIAIKYLFTTEFVRLSILHL